MKSVSHYSEIKSYQTRDGSIIRELMHPTTHHNRNQSLAEAIVPVNSETRLHKHLTSEEIYYITQGQGQMTLDQETFAVKTGDTICIPPSTNHNIKNTGDIELKILCCCAPAYSHEDTELT